MNTTINTVNAWLQLAPALIALIGSIEGLFPKKSGAQKLEAFHAASTAAVATHLDGAVDHEVLGAMNASLAAEQAIALKPPAA